ncbi:MAG: chromosome condensation protein CrcB [Salinarimonadaceae bacterium]|nr:MAG: chromosome condensation protein CrcB [Salinarimonadaceae bacterium]
MTEFALVAAGGAAGSVLRVVVAENVTRSRAANFPFGTLVVNVTGAALLGLLAPFLARDVPAGIAGLTPLFVAGLLGAYTTVSSFSLQTLLLIREGGWGRACLNVAGSVALCLAAAGVGMALGAALAGAIA